MNHDINLLVLSKNSQADDNELERIQYENEMAKLKDELDYQSTVYGTSMERLQAQHEELLERREQMIQENERTLKDIRQHNVDIANDRDYLIQEVAELEARKMQLLGYVNQSQVSNDLSQIQDISPDQTVCSVRFVTPPTQHYDGTDGSSLQLVSRSSSTPHPGGNQNNGYHPFVNDNATQNVGGRVYNGPAAVASGGPKLILGKGSKRKGSQKSGGGGEQGGVKTDSQSGSHQPQPRAVPRKMAQGQAPMGQDGSQSAQADSGTSSSGTASADGYGQQDGRRSQAGQQQSGSQQHNQDNQGYAQPQDGSQHQHYAGGNHHSGGGGFANHQGHGQHRNANFNVTRGGQYQHQTSADSQGYVHQDVHHGFDNNQSFRHQHNDGGGYYNSGMDGNQNPNWNYQGNYGAPRYQNQVGGWNPGSQQNPGPIPNVGNIPVHHNAGNQTLNSTQMSGANVSGLARKPKMTRRTSMSVAMQAVYDNNPGIAALGVDVVSRQADSDTVAWSVEQSQRLYQTTIGNAARRQPMLSDPYTGKSPWRDWYADFVANNNCNSWTEQEALPELIRCLKTVAGRMALNRWREI